MEAKAESGTGHVPCYDRHFHSVFWGGLVGDPIVGRTHFFLLAHSRKVVTRDFVMFIWSVKRTFKWLGVLHTTKTELQLLIVFYNSSRIQTRGQHMIWYLLQYRTHSYGSIYKLGTYTTHLHRCLWSLESKCSSWFWTSQCISPTQRTHSDTDAHVFTDTPFLCVYAWLQLLYRGLCELDRPLGLEAPLWCIVEEAFISQPGLKLHARSISATLWAALSLGPLDGVVLYLAICMQK